MAPATYVNAYSMVTIGPRFAYCCVDEIHFFLCHHRIVGLIQSAGTKGVNDSDIQKEIPVLTAEQRVSIVNKLIAQVCMLK